MKKLNDQTKQAPQGDVLFTLITALPEHTSKVSKVTPDGDYIITHSESGHHHVMAASTVDFYQDTKDALVAYIDVKKPTPIRHLRNFRTHETIVFAPGVFRVNRQAEELPTGWVRVAD